MPSATMDSRGQLVIPKDVREHLGLRPGNRLDFIVQDNGDILLRPVVSDVRRLAGILHRPGRKAVSIEKMNRAIADAVAGHFLRH